MSTMWKHVPLSRGQIYDAYKMKLNKSFIVLRNYMIVDTWLRQSNYYEMKNLANSLKSSLLKSDLKDSNSKYK